MKQSHLTASSRDERRAAPSGPAFPSGEGAAYAPREGLQ